MFFHVPANWQGYQWITNNLFSKAIKKRKIVTKKELLGICHHFGVHIENDTLQQTALDYKVKSSTPDAQQCRQIKRAKNVSVTHTQERYRMTKRHLSGLKIATIIDVPFAQYNLFFFIWYGYFYFVEILFKLQIKKEQEFPCQIIILKTY